MVAGGRGGTGARPPEYGTRVGCTPAGVPEPFSPCRVRLVSGTPPGCCPNTRRFPGGRFPFAPERPPATLCQPFGLGHRGAISARDPKVDAEARLRDFLPIPQSRTIPQLPRSNVLAIVPLVMRGMFTPLFIAGLVLLLAGLFGSRYLAERDMRLLSSEENKMNKVMHAVVLVVFGAACGLLALILKLPSMVLPAISRLPSVPPGQAVLPAFTRLCTAVGPVLLTALALLALGYCIYVWVRKADRPASWIGFLATTMSAVLLVLLPSVVAIYITLVDCLNRLTPLPK